MFVQPAITLEGRQQIQATAAGARSRPLEQGVYDVWCTTAAAYIGVVPGNGTDIVTSATGYRVLPDAAPVRVRIGRDGLAIATTGDISIFRVE